MRFEFEPYSQISYDPWLWWVSIGLLGIAFFCFSILLFRMGPQLVKVFADRDNPVHLSPGLSLRATSANATSEDEINVLYREFLTEKPENWPVIVGKLSAFVRKSHDKKYGDATYYQTLEESESKLSHTALLQLRRELYRLQYSSGASKEEYEAVFQSAKKFLADV